MAATDQILENAVELARTAAAEVTPHGVGDHLGFYLEERRVGTHMFAAKEPGYLGWHWAVTIARPPRGRTATINEVDLLPGHGALLAPHWVPWADRLRPGDLSPSDVLPLQADDPRLDQGFEQTDDEEADQLAIYELGLGRARVLSPEGRAAAFERWYEGEGGPNSESARRAAAHCSTCGFFMKLSGSARRMFGVCANEWSPSDGRVVSIDHGCGAHSETDVQKRRSEWQQSEPVIDEGLMEVIDASELWPAVVANDADADAVPPSSPAPGLPAEEVPSAETEPEAPAEDPETSEHGETEEPRA
ncbi:MAG TPA: DUF3027 domain-containing protein [Actinomycetaceae bacterium]|nr:DUF3027 domain-containing protein [Actinomycetaceae bacterium]